MTNDHDVTRLLSAFGNGERTAGDELIPLVYDALHAIAHNFVIREGTSRTLVTTALVHEAYLKLVDQQTQNLENRSHFFAIAAQAMRRILVDAARRRRAAKRGGGQSDIRLDGFEIEDSESSKEVLDVDEALRRLVTFDSRQARIVECRYYAGFTIEETASILNLSPATVKREWAVARAWLKRELSDAIKE